jgi:hypothetical protein
LVPDANGEYALPMIEAGHYQVSIFAEGLESITRSVDVFAGGFAEVAFTYEVVKEGGSCFAGQDTPRGPIIADLLPLALLALALVAVAKRTRRV